MTKKFHSWAFLFTSLLPMGLYAAVSSEAMASLSKQVYLQSPPYYFDVNFEALFVKPSASNLHYAAEVDPLASPSSDWRIHRVHPDYQFGFDVGIQGIFHGTCGRLNLDWEHFHSLDSRDTTNTSHGRVGPFFEIGPEATPYKKADGHAFFRLDQLNLDYGVFVHFGNRLQTNLFAGVSFAKIRQILHTKFSSGDKMFIRAIKTPSTFTGAGPQIGFDFCYKIVRGFQLTGEGMASLYVGGMKGHISSYKSASPELIPLGIMPPNKQKTHNSRNTQVVPGLEGKLGLCYEWTYCKHYMVKFEVGYQAQIYLNGIQSTDISSEVVLFPEDPSVAVFARTFQETLSNFSLAGPYVRLDLGF